MCGRAACVWRVYAYSVTNIVGARMCMCIMYHVDVDVAMWHL